MVMLLTVEEDSPENSLKSFRGLGNNIPVFVGLQLPSY